MTLVDACKKGDYNEVIKLCKHGVDIHYEHDKAFRVCCKNGNIDIAKLLYDSGADIRNLSDNAFIRSCRYGHIEIAQWIHSLCSDINKDYALVRSSENGHLEIVKWLCKIGADPQAYDHSSFIWGCSRGYFEIAKILYVPSMNNQAINTAFLWSCANRQLEVAKWLYKLGTELKYRFQLDSALELVCSSGHMDVAIWLISLKKLNPDGALISACTEGKFEIAKWLVTLGANISSEAFIQCCSNGHLEMAKWLHASGADPLAQNCCAFNHSCLNMFFDVSIWLHEIGASTIRKPPKYETSDITKWIMCLRSEITTDYLSTFEITRQMFEYRDLNFQSKINSVLEMACIKGHIELVKWLYNMGAKLDNNTHRPFINCCSFGHIQLAQWIIKSCPSSKKYYGEAFVLACTGGQLETAKWLHNEGVDIHFGNDDALTFSCKYGRLEIVKWLNSLGTFNNLRTDIAFTTSCDHGHRETALWILENNYDITDLDKKFIWCCENNYISSAKLLYTLYTLGVNIGDAFIISCSKGNLELAKWLHEIGADIRAQNDEAFYQAFIRSQFDVIQWLCTSGIDIETRGLIIRKDRLQVSELFCNLCPDFHKHITYKFIASCVKGDFDMVKFLCELGANIRAFRNRGFQQSHDNGHYEIAKWLIESDPKILSEYIVNAPVPLSYKMIGISEETATMYECIRLNKPFPKNVCPDEHIVHSLICNDMVDHLIRLKEQFDISFDLVDNGMTNLSIKKILA